MGIGPIARLKALDIVDVASRFTELTGSGDRFKGKCPLHQENTASFYVYQEAGRWRCYGACATGGDVVDLVQRLRTFGRTA
jgi:DNA primase